MIFENYDRIVFAGDSVTDMGSEHTFRSYKHKDDSGIEIARSKRLIYVFNKILLPALSFINHDLVLSLGNLSLKFGKGSLL